MRIPSSRDRDDTREDQSMTSMIDVVFLLLIFFVCASAGQIRESLMPMDLSAGDIQSEEVIENQQQFGDVWIRLIREADEKTVIEISDRRYENRERVTQTLIQLAKVAPELPVILDIGSSVPWGDVIDILDITRAAGFETIHFAADARPAGKKAELKPTR